mmetsp:Transcript_21086/g.41102  ORF Transcript_21086/g.41102 Transcript_21086/m.41102 type:complete len:502 (-) Transcript_21086:773-2278(-)
MWLRKRRVCAKHSSALESLTHDHVEERGWVHVTRGGLGGQLFKELATDADIGVGRRQRRRCEGRGHRLPRSRLVGLHELLDLVDADAVAKVAERLVGRVALRLPHSENGLDRLLEVGQRHLEDGGGHASALSLVGRAAEPQLIRVGPRADKGNLGHVGTSAAVGAAGGARDELVVGHAHLAQLGVEACVDLRLHALGLGHGKAAEREGGAGDRLARDRVDLVDQLDAVLAQHRLDIVLVRRVDVAQHDGLRRRQQQVDAVIVDERAKARLEPQLGRVAHAALLHVDAEHQLAVALLMPAHPVEVLPLWELYPRLERLAVVLFNERAELVDAERVHQVLEPRRRAHLAVAVVALRCDDRLHCLKEVVLLHEAEVVRRARERRLLAVRAAHAAANDDVEALEGHTIRLHHHHAANVVNIKVDGVVAGDGKGDLELLGKVGAAVDGLDRVASDDAVAIIVVANLVEVELLNVLLPVLDGGRLLAIEPNLVERVGHGLEKVGNGL